MELDSILRILVIVDVVITIFPYLAYTLAYKYTDKLPKFVTQNVFIHFAQFLKLMEFVCGMPTLWYAGLNSVGVCIGVPMIFVGQYLNELVYTVLGDVGVYYGLEMKVVKPRRISGFPFTIGDPQYKGSLITILGIYFCFNSTKDLLIITMAWVFSYFYIICIENTKSYIERKKEQ